MEGRLVREQGKGTFVASPRWRRALELASYTGGCGHTACTGGRILEIGYIAADKALALLLASRPGGQALAVHRLPLADDEPDGVATSRLPAPLPLGLRKQLNRHRSLYKGLGSTSRPADRGRGNDHRAAPTRTPPTCSPSTQACRCCCCCRRAVDIRTGGEPVESAPVLVPRQPSRARLGRLPRGAAHRRAERGRGAQRGRCTATAAIRHSRASSRTCSPWSSPGPDRHPGAPGVHQRARRAPGLTRGLRQAWPATRTRCSPRRPRGRRVFLPLDLRRRRAMSRHCQQDLVIGEPRSCWSVDAAGYDRRGPGRHAGRARSSSWPQPPWARSTARPWFFEALATRGFSCAGVIIGRWPASRAWLSGDCDDLAASRRPAGSRRLPEGSGRLRRRRLPRRGRLAPALGGTTYPDAGYAPPASPQRPGVRPSAGPSARTATDPETFLSAFLTIVISSSSW